MPQIITRLFDSSAQADLARLELERAGVPHDAISLVPQDAVHEALIQAGVDAQDAQVYAEGVRRGGTLISVAVEDDQAATVRAGLDTVPYVDLVTRRDAYRRSGWKHVETDAPPLSAEDIAHQRAG